GLIEVRLNLHGTPHGNSNVALAGQSQGRVKIQIRTTFRTQLPGIHIEVTRKPTDGKCFNWFVYPLISCKTHFDKRRKTMGVFREIPDFLEAKDHKVVTILSEGRTSEKQRLHNRYHQDAVVFHGWIGQKSCEENSCFFRNHNQISGQDNTTRCGWTF